MIRSPFDPRERNSNNACLVEIRSSPLAPKQNETLSHILQVKDFPRLLTVLVRHNAICEGQGGNEMGSEAYPKAGTEPISAEGE